jgi:hypothetical protein
MGMNDVGIHRCKTSIICRHDRYLENCKKGTGSYLLNPIAYIPAGTARWSGYNYTNFMPRTYRFIGKIPYITFDATFSKGEILETMADVH